MAYAAYKFWNVLNYERLHYSALGFDNMPSCRNQKMQHKSHFFACSLPSQTAQAVANSLDWAWKSYLSLKMKKEVENPKPPKFKQDKIPITYMQNGSNG